jgi:L-galactonate dehydratase
LRVRIFRTGISLHDTDSPLEPTNPDDVLGHATIRKALKPYVVGVATGEAAQNRVTFEQLLQAEVTDVCQIDAVRLGSVNECLVNTTLE